MGCRQHRPRLVLRLPQHHGRREGPGRSTHRANRDPDAARRCSPHPGRCGRSEPGLVSPRPTSRSPAPAECSPSPSARSSESKPPPFTGKKPQPRPHRPPRHLHRRRVPRKVCCRTSSVTSTPSTKPHPPPVSPKPASPLSLSVGSPVRRRPLPAAAALGRHPRRDRHRRHADTRRVRRAAVLPRPHPPGIGPPVLHRPTARAPPAHRAPGTAPAAPRTPGRCAWYRVSTV